MTDPGGDTVVDTNTDALEWLRNTLEADGSDVLREMVREFAERLMAAVSTFGLFPSGVFTEFPTGLRGVF
jgi:hypothetical protein